MMKAGFLVCFLTVGFSAIQAVAATILTVSIPSQAMGGRQLNATVVVPSTYDTSHVRYPVVYLLHGYSQNHSAWSQIVTLKNYTDDFQILCVCPDGAFNSWYIDSPLKPDSRFETYIAREIPAYIDANFRTITARTGRAIMGSSMGGHGALTIFLKYQDCFAAASSISGIVDLTSFPQQWDIADVLGTFKSHQRSWYVHSVTGLLDSIKDVNLPIFIDCGTNDFALETNRALHKKMDAAGIVHAYHESDGGHTVQYVRKVAVDHIRFLAGKMQRAQ